MPFEHVNDPAMGHLGYNRVKLDFYPTPSDVTAALIPYLKLHNTGTIIHEPACGDGAISNVLSDNGYIVYSTDIKDYGYNDMDPSLTDFLKSKKEVSCIVTNPPYESAEKFVRKSLEMTRESQGVAALLMRHEYDCSVRRNYLFNKRPFARKVTLLWRPRWIPDTVVSPRFPYAWFIWDWKWAAEPIISYTEKP